VSCEYLFRGHDGFVKLSQNWMLFQFSAVVLMQALGLKEQSSSFWPNIVKGI